MIFFMVVLAGSALSHTVAAASGDPPLVFASFGYGTAMSSYGYMSIESAVMTYPSIETFILNGRAGDSREEQLVKLNTTAKDKVTYRNIISQDDLFPTDNFGVKRNVSDSNFAQIHAISLTLRYIQKNHPNAHVVFHDLDILHLQPTLLNAFDKPFTLGLMTRPTGVAAANNCGLMMFHNSRIDEAAAFFELAMQLYRDAGYISKRALTPSYHYCCAQHVIQHALELILGHTDWEKLVVENTYYHRPAEAVTASPSCVADFPGITDSFTLYSYPCRTFSPSANRDSAHLSKPTSESGALHYKDRKSLMLSDYKEFIELQSPERNGSEVARIIFEPYWRQLKCRSPCCLENVGCKGHKGKRRVPVEATCTVPPFFPPHPKFLSP